MAEQNENAGYFDAKECLLSSTQGLLKKLVENAYEEKLYKSLNISCMYFFPVRFFDFALYAQSCLQNPDNPC